MLQKRGNGYYSRLWVPLDVRNFFGRSELKKSLKTSDRQTAKAQDRVLSGRLEQFCLRVRVGAMTENELERLAGELIGEFTGSIDKHRMSFGKADEFMAAGVPYGLEPTQDGDRIASTFRFPKPVREAVELSEFYQQRIAWCEEQTATGLYSDYVRRLAVQNIEERKLDVTTPPAEWFNCNEPAWFNPPPTEFAQVCSTILQALTVSYQVEAERVTGKRNTPLQEQIAARVEAARPKPKLSDLWEAYSRKKIGGERWTANTAQKNLDEYTRIVKLIGDRELHCYDDADAMELVEKLKAAGLKPKSVNYAPELLSAMWKFALDKPKQWHVEYNPFKGLQVADNREDHEQKDPYGMAEIEGMYKQLAKVRKVVQPERFWVPMVCLFSGMRVNEACQLRLEDLQELDGVLMFHIRHRPDMDQTTKNKKSRWCPVHPVLIRLGLKKYIELQQSKKQERLFSNLKLYRGKWHKDVGNWFNRTCEPKYTNNEKHSLHSLRHTFIDWHKHNNLKTRTDEHVLKAVVGHTDDVDANGGITLNRYGTPYSPKIMLKFVQAVDYGVDIGLCRNKYDD